MKQSFLHAQFVEYIPERLEDGVLYISQKYRTATHLCCCGCGEEVVTPLSPADWTLQVTGGAATLYPSIGNWSFKCRSHYWVRNGKVVWAGSMTQKQIEGGRARDQRIRDNYFSEVNRLREVQPSVPAQPQQVSAQQSPDWFDAAWRAFKRWIGIAN